MLLEALAKLNLSLYVGRLGGDGYHPVRTIMQSVTWGDVVGWEQSDADDLAVEGEAPEDETNLAWKALQAVRQVAATGPVRLTITKRIPAGAGLGGGSVDAAAVLAMARQRSLIEHAAALEAARSLGTDVPFCLDGGTAIGTGRGDELEALPTPDDHAYGIVVPAIALPTPEVYQRWDRMGGPMGRELPRSATPPSWRSGDAMRNDLTPAAVDLVPDLGDMIGELTSRWGRPVLMTGSGSGLFGFFADLDEAAAAVAAESGWRAAVAVSPAWRGQQELG